MTRRRRRTETHFVEGRVDSDDILDLVVHLELARRHGSVKVHAVEEAHEEHLRISLSSVSRSRALGGLSDLDDDLLVHRQ